MSDQHHHRSIRNGDREDDGHNGLVTGYRWWHRFGWLRWLFARGGENAGRVAAALFIAGISGWTAWDAYEARRRGVFLLPVVNAERLSRATLAYVIEGADSEGRRADFDLIVANKDFTWKHGTTDHLERAGQILSTTEINDVLFDDLVRARLRAAKELIAVGTASQEGDPTQETHRAGKRAEQAAHWLSDVMEPGTPIWTLNLGQYRNPCTACETNETDWQRPFFLVAVRRAAWGIDLAEALADALGSTSNLPSPDRYTAFGLTRFR